MFKHFQAIAGFIPNIMLNSLGNTSTQHGNTIAPSFKEYWKIFTIF